MTRLDCFSEPYQPTGGAAAGGVLNQLGRPDSEPIEVLVREAVQNCWDARREGGGTVEVEIAGGPSGAGRSPPSASGSSPDPPPKLPLEDVLTDGLQLLQFADFGTAGLGGPTRADVSATGSTATSSTSSATSVSRRTGVRWRLLRLRQGRLLPREPGADDRSSTPCARPRTSAA